MERKRQICMESKKAGRLKSREEGEKKTKKARLAPDLLLLHFHVSAVRQQLLGSSVAANRFCVSDIRLHQRIAPAKLIHACFMRIHDRARALAFQSPAVSRTSHSDMSQSVFINPSRHPPRRRRTLFPPHPLLLLCHADSLPTATLTSPQADLGSVRL